MLLALNDTIPLLCQVDSLVIGGTLSGVSAACTLAKRGDKVLLVEQGTHMLPQMGNANAPYLVWDETKAKLIQDWFPVNGEYKDGEICPFNLDCCKLKLEDKLVSLGIDILYGLFPVKIIPEKNLFTVIFGFRSGLYAVKANRIFRAISTVAETTGKVFMHAEFENVNTIGLDSSLLVLGNTVELLPSSILENTLVRIRFADGLSQFELQSKTFEICSNLLNQNPAFLSARFGVVSSRPISVEFNPIAQIETGANPELLEYTAENRENTQFQSNEKALQLFAKNEYLKYVDVKTIPVDRLWVSDIEQCETLIIGGGTGGAVAAFSSAENGADTVLVEMNRKLGGTGTVGGVHSYWYGNRKGYTKQIDDEVFCLAEEMKYPKGQCIWSEKDSWNPDLKAFVLMRRCQKAGVRIHGGCICIGVIKENNRVTGVLLADSDGIHIVLAEVVIDATGDGDVAALSGAEYEYGNPRDRMTMWSCMAQYKQAGVYKGGIFSTSADIGDPYDYTRYILVNRRRGTQGNYDHGEYICTRESRHIKGDVTVTLKDIGSFRNYPDTVSVCFSNLDVKGRSTSDITYFGYLPPQMEAAIPYRSFVVKDCDGLYVIGKAISATHDALPILRMQDDVQNQGGMIGLAAALCIKKHCPIRALPINELQAALIEQGCLTREQHNRSVPPMAYARLINELDGQEPFEYIEMDVAEKHTSPDRILSLCLANPADVLPLLKAAFVEEEYNCKSTCNEKKLTLARLLLWHGDETGLDVLLCRIRKMLSSSDTLHLRVASTKFCQAQPDHGVMCEVTYLVNILAYSQDARIPMIFDLLLEKLTATDRNYLDVKQAIYSHIESIAYVAERRGLPDLIPALKAALSLPELADTAGQVTDIYQYDVDTTFERLACLKLSLQRALARCGDKAGYLGLIDLLGDKRCVVSKSVSNELTSLLGENYGFDSKRWLAALDRIGELQAHPVTQRIW